MTNSLIKEFPDFKWEFTTEKNAAACVDVTLVKRYSEKVICLLSKTGPWLNKPFCELAFENGRRAQ
jgi:hypothetical protein